MNIINLAKFLRLFQMHNLKTNFDKVLLHTKRLFEEELDSLGNFQFYKRNPKMSDIEIISLSILAEAQSIDSENLLFSKLRTDYASDFPNLPHRTNYNRRRRRLQLRIAQVAQYIAELSDEGQSYIIDSVPIPICSNIRISRSKICKDDQEVLPSCGYHASHREYFYGFKLQLLITEKGIPHAAGITTASLHDSQYLPWLLHDGISNCQLLADKGYIDMNQQLNLFETAQIKLITPLRSNMKGVSQWTPKHRYKRKRVETLFSQLCDQMMLKRNYAKSSDGLVTRVLSKISAAAIMQRINIQENKPLNHIKHALAA